MKKLTSIANVLQYLILKSYLSTRSLTTKYDGDVPLITYAWIYVILLHMNFTLVVLIKNLFVQIIALFQENINHVNFVRHILTGWNHFWFCGAVFVQLLFYTLPWIITTPQYIHPPVWPLIYSCTACDAYIHVSSLRKSPGTLRIGQSQDITFSYTGSHFSELQNCLFIFPTYLYFIFSSK